MKELLFKGSACAIVTPFKGAKKEVDLSKLEELIHFQIENDTQAIVVCGTTGEAATLSYEERRICVKTAVKAVDKKVPIIVGTGSNNTETAVRLSNEAEKEGVDGLLIVTPFYNKASQDGIVAHYKYIAHRVSTPIIVYNVPSRTGVDIKPETYLALSETNNIVGIKEANGNISSLVKTLSLCRNKLAVYSGNDDQTIPFMALGGHGVISVAANVIPKTMQNICSLCLHKRFSDALHLQDRICKLEELLFADVNPIPVKALMQKMKLCDDMVRLPLTPCNDSIVNKLIEQAEELHLIS